MCIRDRYSIIDENYADSRICLATNNPTIYDSIVFINNTVSNPDNIIGMIFCYDCSLILENSFIANNKQNDQYLFGVYSASMRVSNSYIDTTELLYNPDQDIIIGPNNEVSLELDLLSTELCPLGNYFVHLDKGNKIMFTEFIRLQSFEESVASLTS